MGNKLSLTIDHKLNINTFCLTFARYDRLRLIMAPSELVELSEKIILQFWEVQESKKSLGLAEYKLKGTPLTQLDNTNEESIRFKHLICTLIKSYYETGWHLEASMCLNDINISQVIFKKKQPIQTQIGMVSLLFGEFISVIGPDSIQAAVKQAISSSWPNGVSKELNTSTQTRQSYEIQLNGYPWSSFSQTDYFNSPNLICSIFKSAERFGWKYVDSIQTTRKSSLLFRYEPESIEQGDYFALVFDRLDRINIVSPPAKTVDIIKASISSAWSKGIQKEGEHLNTYEFKLKGYPWRNYEEDIVHSKRLINKIVDGLRASNYSLHAICDTQSLNTKLGTFFFKKSSVSSPARTFALGFTLSKLILITDDLNGFSNLVREALNGGGWASGFEESNYFGAFQFELLNGEPFFSHSSKPDAVRFVLVMLVLFDKLDGLRNFKYLTSGDLNDSHSLKFRNTFSLLFECS